MSGARYHVLAAVASVVTLGAGVVVGVGPMSETATRRHQQETAALTAHQHRLEQRLSDTTTRTAGDTALARLMARRLAQGALSGKAVLVVAAPGADTAVVRRTAAALRRAGGTVTGTLTLGPAYVDPAKAQSPLEDLALRLVPPNTTFAKGASSIERVGTVLARATVTDASPAPTGTDQKAAEVIAGLHELGAVSLQGAPGRLAQLAVVVAGNVPHGTDAVRGSLEALTGLVDALQRAGKGTVVVGGPAALGRSGLLSDLRLAGGTQAGTGRAVHPSTVDTAGTWGGDLATVLALVEQVHGGNGAYGSGTGADALVPDVSSGGNGG